MQCFEMGFNTLFWDVKKCFTVNDKMQCFEKLLNAMFFNVRFSEHRMSPSLNEHKKRACVSMQC